MSLSRQQRRALQRSQQERVQKQSVQAKSSPVPPSTGPRTSEGKAISSQNALMHGLTAARLVLPWENQAEFESLLQQLTAEHAPQTITESIYTREMAEQWWRLQRARNQEHVATCRLAEIQANPDLEQHSSLEKQLILASRYATRHERAFHRSFAMLRTLQKERRARELEAAQEAEAAEAEAKAEQFVSQNTPNAPIVPQFVSQNPSEAPEGSGFHPRSSYSSAANSL